MPEALRWGLDFEAIVTKVIAADPDRIGLAPKRRKRRAGRGKARVTNR